MKKLKFGVLTLLSFLILSCQTEEIDTQHNQNSVMKLEYYPEKFTIPTNNDKISAPDLIFEVFDKKPLISCSIYGIKWNTTSNGFYYEGFGGFHRYFGGYVKSVVGVPIMLRIFTPQGIVYEETFTNTIEEFYLGIVSESVISFSITSLNNEEISMREGMVGIACNFISSDLDGDGCLDENDSIPNSNMEETVVLHGCDSQVDNRVTSECGVMMSDLIDHLEEGTYRNHGGFVKSVAHLTETWFLEGLITEAEKDALVSCAGQSN